jgi:hypothetical protein
MRLRQLSGFSLAAGLGLLVGAGVVAGCGGSSQSPPSKQEAAATVNAMFEAWNAGDGETTCGYLTPDGQVLMVKYVAPQLHGITGEIDAKTCNGAVEQTAAAKKRRIGEVVSAHDVTISNDGERAHVASRVRGAMTLQDVGGEWRVAVPTFID